MNDWLKRKVPHIGSAWFAGGAVPAAADFARLADAGIAVAAGAPSETRHWTLSLEHPQWGRAEVACFKHGESLPPGTIEFSSLSESEQAAAAQCKTAVFVKVGGDSENIPRDRKRMLRFLHAVLGGAGVFAFDHVAMRLWPAAVIADEVGHDADLDIENLIAVQVVLDEKKRDAVWIRTQGLVALGGFDFDFIQPERGRGFAWNAGFVRALAAAIVEGGAKMGTGFEIAAGATVQLVPVKDFLARGDGHGHKLLTDFLKNDKGDHAAYRAVVCESGGGLMSRLSRVIKLRAARLPWSDGAEEAPILYSPGMSELLAQRARATYKVLRQYAGEFAGLDCVAAVRLAYPTDDRGPRAIEQLWFEVHNFSDTHIYATLESQPERVTGLRIGDRGARSVDMISDWMLTTPLGLIRPNDLSVARLLRQGRGATVAPPKAEAPRNPAAAA